MSSRLVCEAPEREDSFVLRAGVFPRLSLVSLSSSRDLNTHPSIQLITSLPPPLKRP